MPNCLNCNNVNPDNTSYCSQCGQKTKISELRFLTIITDFFTNLFNIDSKIWNTFKAIWIPAKLTSAYVEGKRKSFYNPLRIFLVVLFAFFTLLLLEIKDGIKNVDAFTEAQQKNIWEDQLVKRYDSLQNTGNYPLIDSFKIALFEIEEKVSEEEVIEEINEELVEELEDQPEEVSEKILKGFKDGWNNYDEKTPEPKEEKKEDSDENNQAGIKFQTGAPIQIQLPNNDTIIESGGQLLNTTKGGFTAFDGIDGKEFFRLSADELTKKYGEDKWYRELFLVQFQKIVNNLSSSISFFISNGTWSIVVTILLMALIFKLLYLRHNYYYAEHFIFHLYGHTRLLLMAIFAFLISNLTGLGILFFNIWWIAGMVYLFLGMLRYYKQSKRKTFVKFWLVIWSYFFVTSLCAFLILAISVVVF